MLLSAAKTREKSGLGCMLI